VIGLLLVLIGVTGSVAVFGDELDRFLNPDLLRVDAKGTNVSLESVLDSVRVAYPERAIARVRLPQTDDSPYEACFEGGREQKCVYVSPRDASILGERIPSQSLKAWTVSLHRRLLSGETGETIVGIAGLIMLGMSGSGLYLWLMRPGTRRRFFIINWRSNGYRRILDLHRIFGICGMLFLSINASTGALMVFRKPVESTLNSFTSNKQDLSIPKSTPSPTKVSLDAALREAGARVHGYAFTMITMPASSTAPIAIRAKQPGDLHPSGRSIVYVDQYTGQVLKVTDALSAPIGTRFGNILFPVHVGILGGMFTRLLLAATGLLPAILFLSGFAMWLKRVRPKTVL
jgi:uncharacterized iron-regulated membrane protein